MNKNRIPLAVRIHMSKMGKKGGAARSPLQVRAARRNLASAREARLARIREAKAGDKAGTPAAV